MFAARNPLPFFRRILAGGCAALVIALAVFAASPHWHERLHPGQSVGDGDRCAVVLFAAGVSLPVVLTAASPILVQWPERPVATPLEVFLSSPRYLRQPERGPPELG
jgi:hypothetical protein